MYSHSDWIACFSQENPWPTWGTHVTITRLSMLHTCLVILYWKTRNTNALIFITIQDSTLIRDDSRYFLSNSFSWFYSQALESPRCNPPSTLPERHVCFKSVLLWFSLLILTFHMLYILHVMMTLGLIDLKTMNANKLIRVGWNYASLFLL